jgi:PAS domain S-box-containing protein
LCVLGSGVREFNPKKRIFRKVRGLEQKKIICIEEDSKGDLWFGSFNNGVFQINIETGELHNYKMGDGLGSNTVFKILNTKNNELWFATNGGGIAKFNGTTFIHFDKEQGFPAPSVLSLIDDSNGNLWIGTEGDGLFKYDGDTFQNYSKKYGIWQDDIYSLICDDEDNVWIGTRRGIEKFNPTTGEIKKYGEFEGFSAIETNQNAVCRDSENRIWFGTIEGAIRFNPRYERINPIPPLTYINDIRLYMQEFSIPEDNTYSYTDNFLTFSFTGLSFVVPEKVRYSYKLEGLDRDWSPLTDERYATYANIPPGDYIFKVKSKNNDNVWSEEAAVYNFSIATPFWQKRWFFMSLFFVLAIIVYGTHRYRMKSIYQNNLRLEKMIHARTKDLVMQKEKAQKSYAALLETENKLKQVTGSIDAYLWSLSFDESGNLKNTFLTDTFFKVVGYRRDEFPEAENSLERFYKIIHPEDRNFVEISLRSMLDGNNINITYRILAKDGGVRWLYDHAFPVKNKQGKVNLIHGVGFDITDNKQAEEALKKSEEKYATFMRYSTEAIWCMDLKKTLSIKVPVEEQVDHIINNSYLSDSNDAMAELYGYSSAAEIIGVPLSAGLLRNVPENREHLRQFVASGYRMKNAEFLEVDRHRKVRTVLVSFVGIIEKEQLVRCWGMQQDITERKKAEEALRESEEIYRKLIERSPDTIVVHSEGKIDFINQAGLRLFGAKKAEELIGRSLIGLLHPDYRELGQNRMQQIYEQKKEVSLIEQKMIRLNGSEIYVQVMGAPAIYKGKSSGQSIIRDITEMKKMEEELQKAQKLESVGILAGGIAHDFNNILTAILGNISLGKLYCKNENSAFSVLGEAEKATLHAKDLTHQLLTFSKGGTPVKETNSIYDLIKESTSFVLRGSTIHCEYEYPPDLWPVEVDAAQMSQVVQNLIINAEQAMPEGKKLKISLKNLILEENIPPGLKPGKYINIKIIDEGIGIPEEHLNKIFDPYFTTKQKGSGLGLATTYSIIRRHDGHIRIDSEVGVGTEVEIYLPASENQVKAKQHASETIENGNGRILVMDDEAMLRELSDQFLTHLGYEVQTVPDGESAITSFLKARKSGTPFSLVIMDLTIPGGMGGKETIIKLKEIDPKIKAVVSSGYSNDPVLARYKEHGFEAVLAKPYKIETLSATIAGVINGKRMNKTAEV